MKGVFDDSYEKMAVELSYHTGSLVDAAKELEIDAGRISKWRMPAAITAVQYHRKTINYLLRNKRAQEEITGCRTGKCNFKKAVDIFSKRD